MSEEAYLISKAERVLTTADYKRKRNRNLALGAAGTVGGMVLTRRGGANVLRGLTHPDAVAGAALHNKGAAQALLGATGSIAGTGYLGSGIYRGGQANVSAKRR